MCAVSSVNVAATVRAMEASLAQINFASCKLFTDGEITPANPAVAVVPISRLRSAAEYSDFVLTKLVDHIETSHCLLVQWDGHVLDAARWQSEFLEYDYLGATWPQFDDGHDVGNGGFSLRSKRLLEECRIDGFHCFHPEDVCIARGNRAWLEERGMRFADQAMANKFSTERAGDLMHSFGYHGVWHMPRVVGTSAFWEIYCGLDDRSSVRHDLLDLMRQVMRGEWGVARALRLAINHVGASFKLGIRKS